LEEVVALHNGNTMLTLSLVWTATKGVSVTVQTDDAPATLDVLTTEHPLKFALVNVSCTSTKVCMLGLPLPSSMYTSRMGLLADTADCVVKLTPRVDGVTDPLATF